MNLLQLLVSSEKYLNALKQSLLTLIAEICLVMLHNFAYQLRFD